MSFRRDKEKALRWQQWLQKQHDELIACGVPHRLLEDQSHWVYFLEHGYYTPLRHREPIITVDEMERGQLEQLCTIIESYDLYPDSSTLNHLQYLLNPNSEVEKRVALRPGL